jgi:hypothetical protein
MTKAKTTGLLLQKNILRLTRLHFLYVSALASQVIIYDSWQLITPTTVLQRWMATSGLLITVTGVWFLAHSGRPVAFYRRLLFSLIAADIAFAAFAVYNQRGMASRAVLLFLIPIVVSAALRNRSAIFATAVICVATYVTAAVSYFVLNFNEGYRIELYGEVGFYCAIFMLVAGLLSGLVAVKET